MAAGPYEGQTPGKATVVEDAERVTGWWYFAGILLTIAGILNLICRAASFDDRGLVATSVAIRTLAFAGSQRNPFFAAPEH